MHPASQVLVTAIVTIAAVAATSVRTDESQTPQQASAVQGWAARRRVPSSSAGAEAARDGQGR